MKVKKYILTFLVILVFTISVSAIDIIYLKDGTKKKGKIIKETETEYVLETFGTKIHIPKSKVLKVEKGVKTLKEIFREKYRKIDKKDVLDLLDLADWCMENGLEKQAKRLYKKVLKLEPDNEEAHEALGHVKVNGKWMTKEEYKEWKRSKNKDEERPKGTDEKQGEGLEKLKSLEGIEKIKELAKQMIEKYKPQADALAKEMIDEIGLDEVASAITDHFIFAGQLKQDVINNLAVLAEVVYWDLGQRFNHNKEFDLYKAFRRKHILLFFKNRADYSDGFDFAAKKWAPGLAREKGFAMQGGRAGFGSSSVPIDFTRELSHLRSKVANNVAHAWIFWHTMPRNKDARDNRRYFNWMAEGIGIWSAIYHTGGNFLVRVTRTHYAAEIEIAKKRGEAGYRLIVKEWAQGKIKKYDRNLRMMMLQKLNRLNFVDLAISFGIFDYLIRTRQDQLKQFLIGIRSKPYEEMWKKAFGEPLVPSFEKSFKEWVIKNY